MLFDQGAFEQHQHGQSEQRIIPIFIEAPQSYAKHLKHEKRCRCPFDEQIVELRQLYVELITAVQLHGSGQLFVAGVAFAVGVLLYRVGDRELQGPEALLVVVPHVLDLLVPEPGNGPAVFVVPERVQQHQFGEPVVGRRDHFDQGGRLRGRDASARQQTSERHGPVTAQRTQRLADADDEYTDEIQVDQVLGAVAHVRPGQVEERERKDGAVERDVTGHVQGHRVDQIIDGHGGGGEGRGPSRRVKKEKKKRTE